METPGKASKENTITLDAEERQEMLQVIDEECDRLDRCVEGLIELARIEAGEMQLRRRWGTTTRVAFTLPVGDPTTEPNRFDSPEVASVLNGSEEQ